jgi:hypothetical protein
LDPAVEGKSYNCAQSRYLMYAGATNSSVDAVTLFDVAADRQIPRLRAKRGDRYQVGLPFVLGRPFTADEDKPGGPLVAILTEPLWREHFGADLISSARISF